MNVSLTEKQQVKLYETLRQDLTSLASVAGLTNKELEKYFNPKMNPRSQEIPCDSGKYLYHLCSSLQNSGMMQNSIKFNDKSSNNKSIIKQVLFDYDVNKSSTYSSDIDIKNAMKKGGIVVNGNQNGNVTNWDKYCKGLYDGIKYLNSSGINEVTTLVNSKSVNNNFIKQNIKKIHNIQKKIYGLGFALTCDWLKECGCTWLAKPDVHIKEVIKYIEKIPNINDDYVIAYMAQWAENIKKFDTSVTAYKLDKIIWLLCTGNFYLDKIEIGRSAVFGRIDSI